MTSNGGTTYVYDAENRLVWTTGGYRYIYDGDGNRVEKCVAGSATTACPTSGTNGTLYWMSDGGAALDESDLSGNMVEQYVFFGGARVARRDVSPSAVHYYFSDQVGSHSVVENAAGTVTEQDIDYYPYGGQENDYSPNVAQHYKFNGKERDSESGLDDFDARHYASSLGRFMQTDPVGGHPEDPQTLNRYAYVRNNPTSLTDPTGLDSYLACQEGQDNCQMRAVGIGSQGVQWANVQTEKVDGKTDAIQIGSDDKGGLKDIKTGQAYTGSANGSGMSFSSDGGKTSSTGIFNNLTNKPNTFQDAGWANGGALSGFQYTLTNSKLEANQTEAGTFKFGGNLIQAGLALEKAGLVWMGEFGLNWGSDEYRSWGTGLSGANSAHFNVERAKINPASTVPTTGNMHFGEHNPVQNPFHHAYEAAQ